MFIEQRQKPSANDQHGKMNWDFENDNNNVILSISLSYAQQIQTSEGNIFQISVNWGRIWKALNYVHKSVVSLMSKNNPNVWCFTQRTLWLLTWTTGRERGITFPWSLLKNDLQYSCHAPQRHLSHCLICVKKTLQIYIFQNHHFYKILVELKEGSHTKS